MTSLCEPACLLLQASGCPEDYNRKETTVLTYGEATITHSEMWTCQLLFCLPQRLYEHQRTVEGHRAKGVPHHRPQLCDRIPKEKKHLIPNHPNSQFREKPPIMEGRRDGRQLHGSQSVQARLLLSWRSRK